jgi:hypothetical protein
LHKKDKDWKKETVCCKLRANNLGFVGTVENVYWQHKVLNYFAIFVQDDFEIGT